MEENISLSWEAFKSEVILRYLKPQFYKIVISGSDAYSFFAKDDFVLFRCRILIGSDESNDFENNYKDDWNKQLSFHDSSGIQQVIPSARPSGTTTFFTGIDDYGVSLDFNMTDQDSSIVKNLTFDEDIWIKDGGIQYKDAPYGAYFSVEVVHPQGGILAVYCKNVFILGTEIYPLNSEDKTLLQQGLIFRVSLFNAPTPTNFKAVGWLEGFRTTLI